MIRTLLGALLMVCIAGCTTPAPKTQSTEKSSNLAPKSEREVTVAFKTGMARSRAYARAEKWVAAVKQETNMQFEVEKKDAGWMVQSGWVTCSKMPQAITDPGKSNQVEFIIDIQAKDGQARYIMEKIVHYVVDENGQKTPVGPRDAAQTNEIYTACLKPLGDKLVKTMTGK